MSIDLLFQNFVLYHFWNSPSGSLTGNIQRVVLSHPLCILGIAGWAWTLYSSLGDWDDDGI